MPPAPWQTLAIERDGSVSRIVMQRPEVHNAFDARLVAELTAALLELDLDPATRAVVLTGAGATFSAGADLNWMRGMAAASEDENREDSLALAALDAHAELPAQADHRPGQWLGLSAAASA